MKNSYLIISSLLLFIFGFYNCTSDNIYTIEDTEIDTSIPVTFFLDNQTYNTKKKTTFSNTKPAQDGESIVVMAEEEEKWDSKGFSETRTSWTNSSNTVTWTAGDRVGIFMQSASGIANPGMDQNNVQYNIQTANSSSSPLTPNSSVIYFPSLTNPMMKFFAYYPYSAINNSLLINYTLPTDQSTAQQLRSADLMNATSSSTNGSNPNVSLAFNHQMVLLSFKINTTLLSSTLTKVTINGTNITNTGTLNLSTSTLTPNTSVAFAPYVTTNQPVGMNTYAYVDIIINPCSITSNAGSTQLNVTLSFAGLLSHSTNLNITSGANSKTFVGGTRYIYNLNVLLSL